MKWQFRIIVFLLILLSLAGVVRSTKSEAKPFENPHVTFTWMTSLSNNDSVINSLPKVSLKRKRSSLWLLESNNKRFIIKYNYDLQGDTLLIGRNSCLDFRGGLIKNGVVIGDSSRIIYGDEAVFSNIKLEGSWNVPLIKSSLIKDVRENNNLKQLFNLTSSTIYNKVIITEGNYLVSAQINNDGIIRPKSNTEIVLDGNVVLLPNSFQDYQICAIYGAENVYFHGRGSIEGDLYEHDYNTIKGTHEWGHGLTIRGCRNVKVEGITVKECTGDACSVGAQGYADLNKVVPTGTPSLNIELSKCAFQSSRRQGLTITFASFVTVDSCSFDGIFNTFQGTAPGAGIDIEPDNNGQQQIERGQDVFHVIIKNSSFERCRRGILSWKTDSPNDTRHFNGLQIENCTFKDISLDCINLTGYNDVFIRNMKFENSTNKYKFTKCLSVDNK